MRSDRHDYALPGWRPAVRPPGALRSRRGSADLGDFTRDIETAGLFSTSSGGPPGTVAALAPGVRMLHRFRSIVRRTLEEHGHEEVDLPFLASADAMERFHRVVPPSNELWYGREGERDAGRRRGALAPTGEPVIYQHWSDLVRSSGQLPLRTYRAARYYRGRTRPRSLFTGVEATDVFEVHTADLDEERGAATYADLGVMLRTLVARLHLGPLVSDRPAIGNRSEVAGRRLAFDHWLPTGEAMQVAAAYEQGTRFSRVFDIRPRDLGPDAHTWQNTAFVSRRALYAHLVSGWRDDGTFLVHPELAESVVAVVTAPEAAGRAAAAAAALAPSTGGGRVALATVPRSGRVHREALRALACGVPAAVIVVGSEDRGRFVVVRGDDRAELSVDTVDPTDGLLQAAVRAAIAGVSAAADRAATATMDQVLDCSSVAEVQTAVRGGAIARCALDPGETAMAEVRRWAAGEILGFVAAEPGWCLATGRPATTVAHVGRRL